MAAIRTHLPKQARTTRHRKGTPASAPRRQNRDRSAPCSVHKPGFRNLRPFQKVFLRNAMAPGIHTSALSLPRGNGKSSLAAFLASQIMSVGEPLFEPGTESVVVAGSLEQGRIIFRVLRSLLEARPGYSFQDSANRIGVWHRETNTRLRLIGSNGRNAFGFLGVRWVLADEPGAWQTVGGELMYDAIQTAMGKPDSELRAMYLGTLAPSTSGWWREMVEGGSHGSTYVQLLQGDKERWDQWAEIRRVNPLTAVSADFRRKLLEERDAARKDSRLKARFMSYRLNLPTADEAELLLTPDDWQRVCGRPVPDRNGRPIVGVDLGQGRAWSAATAAWHSGRLEAVAMAPGIPSIEDQERRDRVPRGTYQRLVDEGTLRVAEGKRVPPVKAFVGMVKDRWGRPRRMVADRFRYADLEDETRALGVRLESRQTRWSECSSDIRSLRRLAMDGPLACEPESRLLLTASLSAALVKNDDQGSCRLVKRDAHNNTGRDDVAAALVLTVGAVDRLPAPAPRRPLRTAIVR